jgi:serine O-acetyltransferase
LRLVDQTPEGLRAYTCAQLRNLIPDGRDAPLDGYIARHLDEALERLMASIDAVRMWRPGEFNYLHSSQYCQYLYVLANTIWRHEKDASACTRLFLLNKALNGIDLFYEIEMPRIFFIGHSVGIVLAKATYGDYLALYQNSTVGKNHGDAPVLGQGVVMYPNTAVIGRSRIGDRTVLSQGVSVINRDTPGDSVVFSGAGGGLAFKPAGRDILADLFRLPA